MTDNVATPCLAQLFNWYFLNYFTSWVQPNSKSRAIGKTLKRAGSRNAPKHEAVPLLRMPCGCSGKRLYFHLTSPEVTGAPREQDCSDYGWHERHRSRSRKIEPLTGTADTDAGLIAGVSFRWRISVTSYYPAALIVRTLTRCVEGSNCPRACRGKLKRRTDGQHCSLAVSAMRSTAASSM